MPKLSILIPARNEEFIGITIKNILENIEDDTEVITVLDGYTVPIPEIPDDPRVKVIKLDKSIGQRAATNLACKNSEAKYVMKCDAHVAFSKGFDRILMEDMQDNWTVLPLMRNLHGFDWACPDGHKRYQGPEGNCTECGKETHKEIVWIGKEHPQSTAFRFDKDMHFQYWKEYQKERQSGDLVETMTIPGSCFMATREKYLELDLCEESYGSWGQQGVEVSCKTWLSGGAVMVNKKCWYAHMFRTQQGFSFPYPQSGSAQMRARQLTKDIFMTDKWPQAIHKFQWLINKFAPVPGWDSNPTKGILYYTDNQLDDHIANAVREKLMDVESSTLPIVSVSLKPIEFGQNIALPLERGYLTVTKQIIQGLELLDTDIVFFTEHDVLYPKEHFDFTPSRRDVYYYNTNSWFLRASDGHCLYYNHRSLSGMSCYRETAIKHFKERLRKIEALTAEAELNNGKVHSLNDTTTFISLKEGIHRLGFEPGTHSRPERIDALGAEDYKSAIPTVDIKHGKNLTQARFRKDQFRNARSYEGWTEAENYTINGWDGEELELMCKP
jgi:hypothetical protein